MRLLFTLRIGLIFLIPALALALTVGPALTTPPAAVDTPLSVQAVYDQDSVALRFAWKTEKGFPGVLHDLRGYDLEKKVWERPARFNEDRISFMLEDPANPVLHFATHGCRVTCHVDLNGMPGNAGRGDTQHYILAEEGQGRMLDMWHWRGGRSGPMGYAEDTWVRMHELNTDAQGRRRDDDKGAPTTLLREKGDRLREDQAFAVAFTYEGKELTLPEFVFNPKKNSGHYFLVGEHGLALAAPPVELGPQFSLEAMDSGKRQHALIATGEKGNALYVPELSDAEKALIAAEALAGGLIPRPVLFDYPSDQHQIQAERAFDPATKTWIVTMRRALDTGSENDVSLHGLVEGGIYTLGAAVHDDNTSGMGHLIGEAVTLGRAGSGANIEAVRVDTVMDVDWAGVPVATVELKPSEPVAWQEIQTTAQ